MTDARFLHQSITLAGVLGETVEFPTADPRNYHEVLSSAGGLATRSIDGKLFVPGDGVTGPVPAVIIVPGSLGVAPSHLAHAETFLSLGFAAFVVDPFGARSVVSTIADQTQYSFAASAYDVLAAFDVLANDARIDAGRIGAQGHSRGGSAVLTAATRAFARPVIGERFLAAVYAAYPWCGHQFIDPDVGATVVRAIIGERDEWCSPQQVQGFAQAIARTGGDATFRLVPGAHHSFDRRQPREVVAEASVSPHAPTVYLDESGAMIHPVTGVGDPDAVDRDLMIYAVKAGYGRRGATIGSIEGEPELFYEDMVGFWSGALRDAERPGPTGCVG